MRKISIFLSSFLIFLLLSGCGEYRRVTKSTDLILKYDYAQKYFLAKKYNRAIVLLEDILPRIKGTAKGDEGLYTLARAYYLKEDYMLASHYFTNYYTVYPKGQHAENARFFSGMCMCKDAPDPRLDQTDTYKAIQELLLFVEYYPESVRVEQAKQMIILLQERLALKALKNATLYYNMGNYMGNNYSSAIITAKNALVDFPETKYKQEFAIIIVKARYLIAEHSAQERKDDRYREMIDEYYAFKNDYPDSEYLAEATTLFEKASKKIKNQTEE